MKKQTLAHAIRESMIRSGALQPDSKKPVPRFNARPNHGVSRLNAVLARRAMTSH